MKRIITLLLLMSLSISAFCTNVTFKVSMKGSGIEYDSIFIVGEQTEWGFVQMADEGDSLFSVAMNLTAGDSAGFYFITIGWWASDYAQYREIVPEECDFSVEYSSDHWSGDRGIVVPEENITFAYTWSSCEIPPGYNPVEEINLKNQGIKVCPNPASELLSVSWENPMEDGIIEILDLSGKLIRSHKFQGTMSEFSFDISELAGGVYLVRVYNENIYGYKKIVIN